MKTTSKRIAVLWIVLILLLSACKTNVSRNQDGSFDVETTISQQELQQAITRLPCRPARQGCHHFASIGIRAGLGKPRAFE